MLVVFLALIVGPLVARKYLSGLPTIPMDLLQPTGQNNNDTTNSNTGSALINIGDNAAATGGGGGGGGGGATSAAAAPSSDGFNFGDGIKRMIF